MSASTTICIGFSLKERGYRLAPPSKQAFSGAIHRVPKHVSEVAKKTFEQVVCKTSQLDVPSQLQSAFW